MQLPPFELENWFIANEGKEIFSDLASSAMEAMCLGELCLQLDDTRLGYGPLEGMERLRELVAREHGTTPERVCITAGTGEANFLAMAAILEKGDGVLVETPAYEAIAVTPRLLGLDVRRWGRRFENGWQPELDILKETVGENTRMLALSSPHNPSGVSVEPNILKGLAELADDKDMWLLCDEIYRELAIAPGPQAFTVSERAISTGSFSKTYGLPGVRIGWLLGPEDVVRRAREVKGYTTISSPIPSQEIAIRALEQKGSIIEYGRERARENLAALRYWLEHRDDAEWVEPDGGLIAFVRCHRNVESVELAGRLLDEQGVMVVPGRVFGEEWDRWLRIGMGDDQDRFQKGLDRLGEMLDSYR